jgi:predicted DNA-binding ribbon-helix-helix protein
MARASLIHAVIDKAAELCSRGLISRTLHLGNRRTGVRLDDLTWALLHEIAERQGVTVHKLCAAIDTVKPRRLPLSTAIRIGVLQYYRDAATESGHFDAPTPRLAPELAPWFRISHVLAKSSESLSISRRSTIRSIIFVEPTGTQVFSR